MTSIEIPLLFAHRDELTILKRSGTNEQPSCPHIIKASNLISEGGQRLEGTTNIAGALNVFQQGLGNLIRVLPIDRDSWASKGVQATLKYQVKHTCCSRFLARESIPCHGRRHALGGLSN